MGGCQAEWCLSVRRAWRLAIDDGSPAAITNDSIAQRSVGKWERTAPHGAPCSVDLGCG